ncbi:hypothetical protein P4534_01005 [Peribacillus butanolivorans]|uniref:hypothetical protein n=1 Tax=Peribacillus butanolivorans TaxID=421767 RepID=UPI002E1A8089|nr:hypothetical protein [Peribacillus butanolivorans]
MGGVLYIGATGSGQDMITMPIMSGLSDLLGVTRQTAILAFQYGDGFTNILYPSGLFMAILAIALKCLIQNGFALLLHYY